MAKTMERESFQVGQLATRAGGNIQSVCYCERLSPLKLSQQRPSRRSSAPTGWGQAHSLVVELLRLPEDQESACSEADATAEATAADIERKIRNSRAMEHVLDVLLASRTSEGSTRHCPLLEFSDDERRRK